MVSNHYYPFVGGVESHVQQISERLVARGHRVEVFTQQDAQSPRHDSDERGVMVRRFPVPVPSTNFAVAPGLLAALRAGRSSFDVLHVHGYHSSVPAMGALADIRPMVFTPHYHGTGHSPLRKALHRPHGMSYASRRPRRTCMSGTSLRLAPG
jgi:glycosyltransferase involved in cell wall biosynthesis